MDKTDKEIVAEILLAQGITAEPTDAAVAAYKARADAVWDEATRDVERAAQIDAALRPCC
jgi:hypothetical protein